MWYVHNFQWIENPILSTLKTYFPLFIDKFLKFEEMEYLIHHAKLEMWQAFF